MAFDFPSSPSEGQIFNAPGGPSYVFNTPVWKAVGQGQIAIISDTPPPSPANGALWYESDSGILFIWYNDGNSSQWVQVGGVQAGAPPPPAADNAEYVMVNGAWRIKAQSLSLAGINNIDIPVPSWAEHVEIDAVMYTPVNNYMALRISGDGTTFAATGYYVLGPTHRTGSGGYGTQTTTPAAYHTLVGTPDANADLGGASKVFFNLVRGAATNYFVGKYISHGYASNAAYLYISNSYTLLAGEGAPTQLRIAALRVYCGSGNFGPATICKIRWS